MRKTSAELGDMPKPSPERNDSNNLPLDTRREEDLLKILMTASNFQETDPRAKIVAVLGMTSINTRDVRNSDLEQNGAIKTDHSKSESDVYQEVTKYLIGTTKDLRGLHLLGYMCRAESSELPSWTSNWRDCQSFFGSSDFDTFRAAVNHSTSKNARSLNISEEGLTQLAPSSLQEVDILVLRGQILATVIDIVDE